MTSDRGRDDRLGETDRRGGYALLAASPAFRRLAAAQMLSRVGDSIHYVALVVLVFDLTRSGLSVSGTVIFEAMPAVLFGTVAGAVVDRFARRRVMIVADVARAGLAFAMAAAGSLPQIYAIAFGLALGALFHAPSVQALVPDIVSRDVLGRANAVIWSGIQSSHVLGSAVGGALVGIVGPRAAFLVNGATFLVAAALVATIRQPATPTTIEPAAPRGLWHDAAEGLRYATRDPFVRGLLVVQLLAVLSVGGTGALLVVLAREQLGVDGAPFGALVAAIGAGAFTGPLVFGRWFDRHPTPSFVFIPSLARGVIDAGIGFMRGFWLPAVSLFVYGLNTSTGGVAYTTLIQHRVPESLRGRVFSTLNVEWQIGRLASIALAGLVAETLGIRAV
jgi:MFS family permease